MYLYETHCHSGPVSKCAIVDIYQQVDFYKNHGFDGMFVTNHFMKLYGADHCEQNYTEEEYKENLDFYFSDYKKALEYGKEIGIKVFLGVEISHWGTDFLIYGLDKQWYYDHFEITKMGMKELLDYVAECGGFVSQAHPYRDSDYIDHIRLYPKNIQAVEILNGCQRNFVNKMGKAYAEAYGKYITAGSDNHRAENAPMLVAMTSEAPLNSVEDFVNAVKDGTLGIEVLFDNRIIKD